MTNQELVRAYIGKVIHFVGGVNQFVGRLDFLGIDVYGLFLKIINPCLCYVNDKGIGLSKLGGEMEIFEPHVLIYQPADKAFEIREVTADGDLAKAYWKEVNRKKPQYIVAPGSEDAGLVRSIHGRTK